MPPRSHAHEWLRRFDPMPRFGLSFVPDQDRMSWCLPRWNSRSPRAMGKDRFTGVTPGRDPTKPRHTEHISSDRLLAQVCDLWASNERSHGEHMIEHQFLQWETRGRIEVARALPRWTHVMHPVHMAPGLGFLPRKMTCAWSSLEEPAAGILPSYVRVVTRVSCSLQVQQHCR